MDTCRRERDNDAPREEPWWRNGRGTRKGGGRMPKARGEARRVNETKHAMRNGLGLSASPCSLVLLVFGRGTSRPGIRSAPLSKLPTPHAPCPSPHRERTRADVEAIAPPKKGTANAFDLIAQIEKRSSSSEVPSSRIYRQKCFRVDARQSLHWRNLLADNARKQFHESFGRNR